MVWRAISKEKKSVLVSLVSYFRLRKGKKCLESNLTVSKIVFSNSTVKNHIMIIC